MISFSLEDTQLTFNHKLPVKKWIDATVSAEGKQLGDLSIVFCSDDYLLSLNRKYLDHDYYTDIITFPLGEPGGPMEGELYLSVDRIRENASQLGVSFLSELLRVIIHGVLHLVGFDDQTEEERTLIRSKEDYYLNLLQKSGWDFT